MLMVQYTMFVHESHVYCNTCYTELLWWYLPDNTEGTKFGITEVSMPHTLSVYTQLYWHLQVMTFVSNGYVSTSQISLESHLHIL